MRSVKLTNLLMLWLITSVVGTVLKILHYSEVISDTFLAISFIFIILFVIKIINNRS